MACATWPLSRLFLRFLGLNAHWTARRGGALRRLWTICIRRFLVEKVGSYEARLVQMARDAVVAEHAVLERRPRVQRAATRVLRDRLAAEHPLSALLQQRLARHFRGWQPFLHKVNWEFLSKVLYMCPTSWSMAVLKTYLSGWLTSSRSRHSAGQRLCIFGCSDQADRLMHYLRCPVLLEAVFAGLGRRIPRRLAERMGLLTAHRHHMQEMTVSFNVYHDLRVHNYVAPRCSRVLCLRPFVISSWRSLLNRYVSCNMMVHILILCGVRTWWCPLPALARQVRRRPHPD